MRAAVYDRPGPAREVLRIETRPDPAPVPGEVLVRVHASGVNPSDVKTRAAWMKTPKDFPLTIPHSDGAGVIEGVGEGVDPGRVGQRVWLWNAQWGRPDGTAAELCALAAAQAVPLPETLSFDEGACLGIPARTGWVAAMEGRPAPGRRLLVHGVGAVGLAAIAVAARAGAEVIAVAAPDRAEAARAAGAAHAVPRGADVAEAVAEITAGQGVDHVVEVDFGANWAADVAALAANGSIAAYSSTSAPEVRFAYYAFAQKAARVRMVQVYLLPPEETAACHAALAPLLAARAIPLPVAAAYPLDRIAEAHEMQETGRPLGNVVVRP
jgi:NADPH2:quinone reductase